MTPSTAVQFTAPPGVPQRPGFVWLTACPFGALHVPPQQSLPVKHISPFCRQYDEALLHVPLLQSPEQQSPSCAHVLPEVRHAPPAPPSPELPIAAHLPFTHVSVQHVLVPAAGHALPIETHCALPHVPLTQAPLQQSVLTPQLAPALPHVETDDTQTLPRQRLEQQSAFPLHAACCAAHFGTNAASLPVAPPSSPVADPSVVATEPSLAGVPPSSPGAFESPELPHASGAAARATMEPRANAVRKR
jgi:hypothetical protein